MIRIQQGDIANATERIIAHNVNCKGVMGSGVAKTLRDKYTNLFSSYIAYLAKIKGENKSALGTMLPTKVEGDKYICNLFAQDDFGILGDGNTYTSMEHFKKCLIELKEFSEKENILEIALPFKIGCGRGGANWNDVYFMITDIFRDSKVNITLYKFIEKAFL